MKRAIILLGIVLLALAFAGCVGKSPAPTATFVAPTVTRRPTRTVTPTLSPTLTLTPTLTALPSPTPSASLTPPFAYDKIKVYTQGHLQGYRYFVAFKFPQKVEGEYHAIVDKNKPYRCEVLSRYPDRLYCSGPLVGILIYATIDLYAKDRDTPIFTTRFFIPEFGQ
ncbi:MAG: hypothetical protein HPY45_04740 [Anaerolineae bacterium]|nr:hypothetical protein [Anaerolineae bacterium]